MHIQVECCVESRKDELVPGDDFCGVATGCLWKGGFMKREARYFGDGGSGV